MPMLVGKIWHHYSIYLTVGEQGIPIWLTLYHIVTVEFFIKKCHSTYFISVSMNGVPIFISVHLLNSTMFRLITSFLALTRPRFAHPPKDRRKIMQIIPYVYCTPQHLTTLRRVWLRVFWLLEFFLTIQVPVVEKHELN